MRPRGEIREALARGLELGAGHTRELALRTGVGVSAARCTLDNMVRAGEVMVLPPVRLPGVKRPVPVYSLAQARAAFDWMSITSFGQWPREACA